MLLYSRAKCDSYDVPHRDEYVCNVDWDIYIAGGVSDYRVYGGKLLDESVKGAHDDLLKLVVLAMCRSAIF